MNEQEQVLTNTYKLTETENYTIGLNNNGLGGYFEHHRLGEDKAGELLINEQGELYDYDGCWMLPKEVALELESRGVNIAYVKGEYK